MTLLLTVFTTLTTWADTWPAYITDVVLAGGTETEAQSVKNSSTYSGYTWCSKSLNDGTSGDVIYIGYKKSSSPAYINGGYITDFIIIDAGTGTEGHNPPYSLTFQGRTYYRCPAAGGDYFVNSNHGNLTSQAANGWNMYLYYTKDNFSDKRAVDGISIYSVGDINEHKSGAINCYYKDGTLHEAEISLNKGVSKTPYVYMHINTVTKTNRPSTDPVMASGLVYNGSEQLLVSSMGTTYDNTYKMYFREIGQNQYFYEGTYLFTKATNAGTYNVEYKAGSNTYGNESATKTHQVTIAKSANSGVTVACADVVDGYAPAPHLRGSNLSTGAVTYQYSTTQNGTYTTTVPTDFGKYWVKATIAADDNCYAYTTAAASFYILADANDLWNVKGGANGTVDHPIVISTPSQLDLLAKKVNGTDGYTANNYSGKYFELGADITYDGTENNYTPIGSDGTEFGGHFDGKGHTVSGININLPSKDYIGLFGKSIESTTIQNLTLDNSRIAGYCYCGGIVGFNSGGTVENCHVTSSVTILAPGSAANFHGGIVGRNDSGIVRGCTSAATLEYSGTSHSYYGGIAGCNHTSGTIRDCLVYGGSVSGTFRVGAVVGNNSGTLTNNHYTGVMLKGSEAKLNAGVGGDGSQDGTSYICAIIPYEGVTLSIPSVSATTEYPYDGLKIYPTGMTYKGQYYNYISNADAGISGDVTFTATYSGSVPEDYALGGFGYTSLADATDVSTEWAATDGSATCMLCTDQAHTYYIAPSFLFIVWGGGDGSQENPYIIYNTAGMDKLASDVNSGERYSGKYFELGNDITYDRSDNNYTPIGDITHSFSGTFDGKGHTISGIRISDTGGTYKAIFGGVDGTIKNLVVGDCCIEARQNIGGIVASLWGTIENCHVGNDVTLSGNSYVGGIAGSTYRGTIKGCTSAAKIIGTKYGDNMIYSLGGIAGYAKKYGGVNPTLTDNLFTGTISGELGKLIGDIVGWNSSDAASLTNNYYTTYGLGGVGSDTGATGTDVDGALIAMSSTTMPDEATIGTAGTPYVYQGITPYTHGLYYDGHYYYYGLWSGSGTENDPYVIRTTTELDKLASDVNSGKDYANTYFALGADITYEGSENNYTPIGDNGNWFSGTFDGQGHKVSGIRISDTNGQYKAIFGIVDGTVKNLVVSDCRIEGYLFIGGIVTHLLGTIENCHVGKDVTLSSKSYIGGIATQIDGGTIKGCTSAATIIGTEVSGIKAHSLGGIVGSIQKNGDNTPTLTDNLFTGTISGDLSRYIGAIVGYNVSAETTLTKNYHTCSSMGGFGREGDATGSDVDGATIAYELAAANGAMGAVVSTYGTGDYTGITVYEHGLAYNGKFYSPSPWGGSGTAEDPYIIVNTQGMDLLATNVNGGNYYQYTYFVLGNDIVYAPDVLTLDLDGDGNNDSNYMPVGNDASPFYGNFDGQGHTISGISVNANGMYRIGVFGINDGTVKNLTVSDCLFAGRETIGAIAGMNRGTVENCHVAADVSVIGESSVGGVVGENDGGTNEGFVLGCTSAATLSAKESADYFGGIAGINTGMLTDNLFTGTIGEMPDGSWGIGAITGYHDTELGGTLTNNFHTCSGMGGVGNMDDATNTDQDGAQFAVARSTQPDASIIGEEKKTYGGTEYTGITAYEHGLYYNGKYYYWSEDIVVPGDANGDGMVTISDAVAIVNYILGKPLPAGFNEAAADMNGDGKVTITDAVMLVNMIGSQP